MNRKVQIKVKGYRTQDGAGVKLVRVLGHHTVEAFDPILMLDSFDSVDPNEYIAGFPMHPHRGIETISYLYKGKMQHKDNLGFEDTITDGEVQWMTAGSGILHEERLPASDRMLGVQLWLNLPKESKMVPPEYHAIKADQIKEVDILGGHLRLLAGNYQDMQGFQGKYLPLDYYDIDIYPNQKVSMTTNPEDAVMIFTLVSDVWVEGEHIEEKTAVRLSDGEQVVLEAKEAGAKVLFISSKALKEAVYWGGPIVMNTQEDLKQAFVELQNGTFIK